MIMLDNQQAVSEWVGLKLGTRFSNLLGTVGYLDKEGTLIGAAVLHDHTKYDVELTYFGKGTLSLDMCKAIAWLSFIRGNVLRVSICVPRKKKRLRIGFEKIGWKYEGIKHRYFGPSKNCDGIMYWFSKDDATKFLRGKDGKRSESARSSSDCASASAI